MVFRPWLAILLLFVGLRPGIADETAAKTPPPEEQQTLEAYGRQNLKCEEWSDGCAVCTRQDDANLACSLPGIACQPGRLVCRREKATAEPEKSAK